MRNIIFFTISYLLITSGSYANTNSIPAPTPKDLENQKKLQADPLFPSIYRGHVNAIIGYLVNKKCVILTELESKQLKKNTTIIHQKLLPAWFDKHFKLSNTHKKKFLYDAGIIGYNTSQRYKDCKNPSTQNIIKDAKSDQLCSIQILAHGSKDLSCFSFYQDPKTQ